MEPNRASSPRSNARMAGAFYLLTIVAGAIAATVGGRFAIYGDAANLVATGFYVIVTLLFYGLFRPVNRGLSLLAALFSLAGCAVGALRTLHHPPFEMSSLVFFGFYCLLIGYLILKSTFLPRTLGVLMTIAGLGWLTLIWPPLAHSISPYFMLTGLLGEGSLTVWLLVKGVNEEHWREQDGVRAGT